MAIDRLRSPYNNMLAVTGDVGPAAYSNAQVGGSTPYTFIGTGATNTIVGVTYRVHLFTYTPGQNYTITFNRAGNVDLLVLAGGGGGGGAYGVNSGSNYGVSGGGGGAGGLILSYNYGVTATTYSLTVGKGGYDIDGLGQYYYNNAAVFAQNSVFGALTAIRGGHGGTYSYTSYPPQTGGSGGGSGTGTLDPATSQAGAAGTAGQGNRGGNSPGYAPPYTGGGGGGYSTAGQDFVLGNTNGRAGGDGITLNFDGQSRTIAAGGGSGGYSAASGGVGGSGGAGGAGGSGNTNGTAAAGWGNGGGGSGYTYPSLLRGGAGTDGLVIIRYPLG